MDTSFRDGFQSCYGARVLTEDFLPAVEASYEAGITHFEVGGGARFQSLFFYCNESAFDMMNSVRKHAPTAQLQTLARGINVVALSQQPKDIIELHAKLFKKHSVDIIRNFDALNDINNLKFSAEVIKKHDLHHQVVITLMDLPPGCEGAHTTEFYIEKLDEILKSNIPFDSIAFKDASGTANPRKVYETLKHARKKVSSETILWFHTHDTAGVGISQNIAAIEGGADGIDLSKAPCSGGTCQPDIISMWHALKGTEYTIDVDVQKIIIASEVFQDCMKDYYLPPEATKISPIIPLSPMPGGALTANTMMMRDTNTLHLYNDVIKEMSEVVKKGGFGTSVTPVSQFYFQQAYANVTQGQWKKITQGYGNMVLGYFGKTPVRPDQDIIDIASKQLNKKEFSGDPLSILEPGIPQATKMLQENNLPITEENIFIVASCEEKGIQFLLGKTKVNVRKTADEPAPVKKSPKKVVSSAGYTVTVDGKSYFVEVSEGKATHSTQQNTVQNITPLPTTNESFQEIEAPTPGNILKILVSPNQQIKKEQPLLVLEAMKMETEIKSPFDGTVNSVEFSVGDTVQTGDILITVA